MRSDLRTRCQCVCGTCCVCSWNWQWNWNWNWNWFPLELPFGLQFDFPPTREGGVPTPFFLLLHLFFAAIHIRLSPPLPCPPPRLSRSRSECLNKIKSVPACASTGSYRMNGSRRHCSAQHWLPRTRSPTLTTTCASASASEREKEKE